MDTRHQDLRREKAFSRAAFSVMFTDGDHLMDVAMHVFADPNKTSDLVSKLVIVLSRYIGDAACSAEFLGGPDGTEPARSGRVVRLVFSPESPNQPSFHWRAEYVPDIPAAAPVTMGTGTIMFDGITWRIFE